MRNTGDNEMKKKYYSWQDVERAADSIVAQMCKDQWCPEYITGINRGGLPLAMLLSHKLDTKMYTVDIQLRDGKENDCESNLWLAEWAFGYVDQEDRDTYKSRWDCNKQGHIAKHSMNVEVYLKNAAGVGEHPDVLEAIEQELKVIAEYHDQLEMLEKYF